LFAIDGVKLPSNAAKARSGTREEFADEATKMEAAVAKMIERQRIADASGLRSEAQDAEREAHCIERLSREAAHSRARLTKHPEDRRSPTIDLQNRQVGKQAFRRKAKARKIRPRPAEFSLRFFKSDRTARIFAYG